MGEQSQAFYYNAIKPPEYSGWTCHLFGADGNGISWTPLKGKEPNRFWRWMQFVCFGNRWVKDDPTHD